MNYIERANGIKNKKEKKDEKKDNWKKKIESGPKPAGK